MCDGLVEIVVLLVGECVDVLCCDDVFVLGVGIVLLCCLLLKCLLLYG